MIHVIATIHTAADRRVDLVNAFEDLVPLVRAERGCIEYEPTLDLSTPISSAPRADVVTVVEKWESVEALKDHLVAPHMIAYKQKVADIIVAIDIRVLEPA